MTTRILVTIIVAAALVSSALTAAATQVSDSADDRLLIVNGKTGRVIYDDGKDDLFCVTRKVIVGYDGDGDPIRKRVMRCR